MGLRSNAQRSAKKGGEGFERRGCDGALPSSRHANNFLSPRKAGQGPEGGGANKQFIEKLVTRNGIVFAK